MEESVEEEDRISLLPDCLVIEILCRLPSTKYAIRTSVLSKRWQHLWTFVHTLIFRECDINRSQRRRNFLSLFEKTITQCQSKKLNKVELQTSFRVGYESHLNNAIHYAISCNVQEFYLRTWNYKFELKGDIFFNNSCFTHLRLARCIFSPSRVISWNKLTSLYVSFVKLDESLIQNILSGSPLLETLQLECCYGYRKLDITSKSVKNLIFSGYHMRTHSEPHADIIEISAPNILSLTIDSELFLLLDVSSLLKSYLNYENHMMLKEQMLKGILRSLHHVKELKVGISCLKVLSRLKAKGFVFPSNMKVPGYATSHLYNDSDSLELDDYPENGSSDSDSSDSDSSHNDSSDSDQVESIDLEELVPDNEIQMIR